MALFGKVQDLLAVVHPSSRLQRGLALLLEFQQGRRADWTAALNAMQAGDKQEIPIEGRDLFAILQCYRPKDRTEARFEAHERYTDLQYLTAGAEWIEVCDLHARMPSPTYDAQGNVFFPMGDPAAVSRIRLGPGDVAVLFPPDAHAPCLRVENAPVELVRKIVIKVRDACQIGPPTP
ncbi:MAG: YhcH/YjgK/YiaL family protein [Verrucomicrobiae bacterium]|nr:YhcH/YjgK/YiaL family protein [Verrucomicrobiae bacterium]